MPQVVVISVDGAKPDVFERLFASGGLDRGSGLGRLAQHRIVTRQNVSATPSVTAVAHASIATGSTAAHHDIPGNYFQPVGAPIASIFVRRGQRLALPYLVGTPHTVGVMPRGSSRDRR
jgi:hypothetical protein